MITLSYFLTILLLLTTSLCFGTCVVVVKKQNEITIGADSKRVVFDAAGKPKGDELNCKIRKIGRFYMTLVGAHDDMQLHHATKAEQSQKTFVDYVGAFTQWLANDYPNYLKSLKLAQPELYKKQFSPGSIVAEVALFGLEDKQAKLVIVRFWVQEEPNGDIYINYRKDWNPQVVTYLGYRKELPAYHASDKKHFDELMDSKPKEYITAMIRHEESIYPDAIGGPIDIISVTHEAVIWVEKKDSCI